jgi:hypothetical protein
MYFDVVLLLTEICATLKELKTLGGKDESICSFKVTSCVPSLS